MILSAKKKKRTRRRSMCRQVKVVEAAQPEAVVAEGVEDVAVADVAVAAEEDVAEVDVAVAAEEDVPEVDVAEADAEDVPEVDVQNCWLVNSNVGRATFDRLEKKLYWTSITGICHGVPSSRHVYHVAIAQYCRWMW